MAREEQCCFGGSTKGQETFSSIFEKANTSAACRPCSAFEKDAMNFHLQHPNWFLNWQLKNEEEVENFKGLSEGEGRAKFAENLRASLFNKDLSNETTFSLNHLAGQYL